MNKVTAKLNNNVRKALAQASDQAKADPLCSHNSPSHQGPVFSHFSYDVDWSNFPNSLMVYCHFKADSLPPEETSTRLNNCELLQTHLSKLVQLSLLKQGIKFRDFRNNFSLEF